LSAKQIQVYIDILQQKIDVILQIDWK
jgi:hypothetical protein